jgi:emfourin
VRITFQAQGGIAFIPGLSKPVVIATEQLPLDTRAKLEALVRAANFFALPPTVGKKLRGAADYRQYTIEIEDADAGHTHAISVIEPFENPKLEDLISALQAHARSQLLSGRNKA